MRKTYLCLLFMLCVSSFAVAYDDMLDDTLEEIVVEGKDGWNGTAREQSQQVDVLTLYQLRQQQVSVPKDVALQVPNLVMPDYGSAMTSTIYMRGNGSRIDQPVLGLLVDGVPILDKNAYDAAIIDLRKVEVLRGPHGTLFGRNTMGGIMQMFTLQPLDVASYEVNAQLGYATANTFIAQASLNMRSSDSFGWSVAAQYDRTDGFFRNRYTNAIVDGHYTAGGRAVLAFRPNAAWHITNTLSASWTDGGAFPYASYETRQIAFNDESTYRRMMLSESVRAIYDKFASDGGYRLELTGTYQFLADRMQMDQDYTPQSIFSLEQKQRMHNAMVDALLRGKSGVAWYDWSAGAMVMLKQNTLSAPVTFMREGIQTLILNNANRGIQKAFEHDSLEIAEQTMPIYTDMSLLNLGAALYHESMFTPVSGLHISAGVRIDVEMAQMLYDARAALNYRITGLMAAMRYYELRMSSAQDGVRRQVNVQVLPRVSVRYDWERISLYGYAAKGSKAGGYNPQIFSTIMQNKMMTGMMEDMGVYIDGLSNERYTRADVTEYAPETAWTGEIGVHAQPYQSVEHRLAIDADVFYCDMRNQQVTIFPEGKTTGRMMSNAAHSRSFGAEAVLRYRWMKPHWEVNMVGSYGYTNARFVSFNNGVGDYSGNYIPYSPRHTAALTLSGMYRFLSSNKYCPTSLSLALMPTAMGPLYWDEANVYNQPLYALLNATMSLQWRYVSVDVWAKNITDTRYDTFFFVSMGNAFLQQGKPRTMGVTLYLHI